MPTYEYRCKDCGDFEIVQKITEDELSVCPRCKGRDITRLLSLSSFHLKGSGWYKTDYASSNGNSANGDSSSNGNSSDTLNSKVEKSGDSTATESKSGDSTKSETTKTPEPTKTTPPSSSTA